VKISTRCNARAFLLVYSKLKEEFVQRTTLLKPGTISLTRPDKPNDTVTIGPHVRVRSWKRPTLMSFARPFRSPAAHEPLRGCIFAIEREIEILSLSLSLSPPRVRGNGRHSLRSPNPLVNPHAAASSDDRWSAPSTPALTLLDRRDEVFQSTSRGSYGSLEQMNRPGLGCQRYDVVDSEFQMPWF
jgi:hypothetical protein